MFIDQPDQPPAILRHQDPGRSALRAEWAVPGTVIFEQRTERSGDVLVTGSGASSGGSWRRLRFNDNTEQRARAAAGSMMRGSTSGYLTRYLMALNGISSRVLKG